MFQTTKQSIFLIDKEKPVFFSNPSFEKRLSHSHVDPRPFGNPRESKVPGGAIQFQGDSDTILAAKVVAKIDIHRKTIEKPWKNHRKSQKIGVYPWNNHIKLYTLW